MTTYIVLVFWLLVGHAVCDYPLQGDFLAKAKNHKIALPGIPWSIALVMHALMHAGAVALVTGDVGFGCCEFVLHAVIDWCKCQGLTDFTEDQMLHVVCKLMWAGLAVSMVGR